MKLFKHIHTVNKHRRAVRKLCFKCGIYKQGLMHDLSKYSLTELRQAKYWTGKRSPIDVQIEVEGFSEAWLHHKGRNKHHYEYWQDQAHGVTAPMPIRYVAEMFCDRVAACKTYLGDKYTISSPLEYMDSKPQEKELMHPATYKTLHDLFNILATCGENKACEIIRGLVSARVCYWKV